MVPQILVVEDDPTFAERLRRNFEAAGFAAEVAPSGEAAVARLPLGGVDLVVTDLRMPGISGIELLRKIREQELDGVDPELPVVVLTSVDSVDSAVEAMKLGASDYITKEADRQEVLVRLRKVLAQHEVVAENRILREAFERRDEFRDLVGDSEGLRRIKDDIAQIAAGPVTVLITGETGVGKELVARALHRTSPVARGPFVDVNCAALPDENLLLSELFGHERGAFTGATELRRGKFEQAHRGTLFLDEIGDLSRDSQARILKALEQQTVTRLGGSRAIAAAPRLIFATNKDLQAEVAAGNFREDLLYRINVFPIHIPPLRERRSDVPQLAKFFADQFSRKYGKPEMFFEESAMLILRDYPYPGNIRELRNIIERLVIRARGDVLTRDQVEQIGVIPRTTAITADGETAAPTGAAAISLPEEGLDLAELEQRLVVEALDKTGWNQKDAAALLNISVDRMNSRVRKFGLKHPKWRVHK